MRKDIESPGSTRNPGRSGKIDAGLRVDSHEKAIRTGTQRKDELPAAVDWRRLRAGQFEKIGDVVGRIVGRVAK